jgi:DNA-binding winged helix-turn-helix (wHTH) protein
MFAFGPFELDEPRRVLRLNGRELTLQPRVFSLLALLVQKRTQVVSKEELLETLWPNVIVSEGSLQRAISLLRAALRQGGMESALRSFPRIGYRLCLDEDAPVGRELSQESSDQLAAARRAIATASWPEAAAAYKAADAQASIESDDLERWAFSLQCQGHPAEAIPILIRAVSARSQAGETDDAAFDAVALSTIHLERGEVAVAKGWLTRAETLVTDAEDSPAMGRIFVMQARIAAFEGDPQHALALADRGYVHGQRLGLVDTEALGLMYRGFARLCVGDTRGGLADQDHAAALALAGRCDPITGGTLYCTILWACRSFGDWARANQWTLGYQDFCSRSAMKFSGSCQLHRAEVLGVRGSLGSAVEHIEQALDRLKNDAPWAQGDAYRVLGDIHAAAGNGEAALDAYQKAYALGWDPEPGHAMLLLECGKADAACASLERSLVGNSWWTLQRRGILLAHLAVAAAQAGRVGRAQEIVDELTRAPERWPMPSIRALVSEASAHLAQARGDRTDALHHLHLARQLWTSIDSPIHAVRLRLLIAEQQIALNDCSGAETEIRVAQAAAKLLDSEKLQRACRHLAAQVGCVA